MKVINLLGATGSIGRQVLDIVADNPAFKIGAIAVGKNIDLTRNIIQVHQPSLVSVLEADDAIKLEQEFPRTVFVYGEEGLLQASTYGKNAILVNAVVGMVGLKPTIAAIKNRQTILLANKETLVVGGEIINKLVKEYQTTLLPIDSEHNAIFQCLIGRKKEEVKKIVITASGGAFRNKTRDQLAFVKKEDALQHPNWSMGAKITIDSATMVNKGLEVMEAHYLFDLPYEQITTVLHPESIVHSMVEWRDGSVSALLSQPDMRLPIQFALYYPKNSNPPYQHCLDWTASRELHFQPMDLNRYPLLNLAYHVGKEGGILPAVYNASNEEAVSLFLENKISFLDIENIIVHAVGNAKNKKNPTIDDIMDSSQAIRNEIKQTYLRERMYI